MTARETVIKVAEYAVARGAGTLATFGLGSCVAIILSDPAATTSAMAHVLLPSASLSRVQARPAKFPETALPVLLGEMVRLGAERTRIVARLIGGASMFQALQEPGSVSMGERNVLASHAALRHAGVPVVAERTGGTRGRSVWVDVATGRALVRSIGVPDANL